MQRSFPSICRPSVEASMRVYSLNAWAVFFFLMLFNSNSHAAWYETSASGSGTLNSGSTPECGFREVNNVLNISICAGSDCVFSPVPHRLQDVDNYNATFTIFASFNGIKRLNVVQGDNYFYCMGEEVPMTCTAASSCSNTAREYANCSFVDVDWHCDLSGPFCRQGYDDFTGSTTSVFCSVVYRVNLPEPPPPPPCSNPVSVSDNRCEGGQGLWAVYDGNSLSVFDYYLSVRHYNMNEDGSAIGFWFLPNGSRCATNYTSFHEITACPLGFSSSSGGSSSSGFSSSSGSPQPCEHNDEDPECVCAINPNAIICPHSSSSIVSVGTSSSSSGSICDEFPNLPQCECNRNSSLPWCSGIGNGGNNGGSGSNGGSGNFGSSSSEFNLCENFPTLWVCQGESSGSGNGGSSGSGGNNGGSSGSSGNNGGVWFGPGNGGSNGGNNGGSSGSSGGSNGGGEPGGSPGGDLNGTCLKNNNCNWARIDVQLQQLGVETEIRNFIKDVVQLQAAGYNLSNEQNILLHSVVNAVSSGNADVVNAINGLVSSVNSASSANNDSFNSSLASWHDMMNSTLGSVSGSIDGLGSSLRGGLDSLKGSIDNMGTKLGNKLDSIGSIFGKADCEGDACAPGGVGGADTSGLRGKANSIISGGGSGFTPYTNEQINSLIPSSIGSYGSQCPVIDKQLKFYGTSIPFHMDFNDLVPGSGFNLAKFIRALLLISVYFINAFSMIAIFRSGGRQ